MKGLVIIADDFGIGPETTRGILELGGRGIVTGSVLLVNSPYAYAAVAAWRDAGMPFELGWHANLTLDRPLLPVWQVASLVDEQGRFWPLATFLRRLLLGAIEPVQIRAELLAQHAHFKALIGHEPTLVNGHHHLHIFPTVGTILSDILRQQDNLPYVRRVREPWSTLACVPGARWKRLFLSTFGSRMARRQEAMGFPGCDGVAGNTSPRCVKHPEFLSRWLDAMPERVIELVCHPGHRDETLPGREGAEEMLQWRVNEWRRLSDLDVARFGRVLMSPADVCARELYAV